MNDEIFRCALFWLKQADIWEPDQPYYLNVPYTGVHSSTHILSMKVELNQIKHLGTILPDYRKQQG